MHSDVLRAWAGWCVGGFFFGLAGAVLCVCWWWTFARERFGWPSLAARAAGGLFGCASLLVGMVLTGVGTELFYGDPLGRWGGASMVPGLWVTLEIYARDTALVAGLGTRDLGTDAVWIWARAIWIASWGALVLSGFVGIWALLGV